MADQSARVPRIVAGVDVRSLPLTPLEGFVLSRIDGVASVGDIADLTSLDETAVAATLEKLARLDAVEWVDRTTALPRPSARPSSPFARASSDASAAPKPTTLGTPPGGAPAPAVGSRGSGPRLLRAPRVPTPHSSVVGDPRKSSRSSELDSGEAAPSAPPVSRTPAPPTTGQRASGHGSHGAVGSRSDPAHRLTVAGSPGGRPTPDAASVGSSGGAADAPALGWNSAGRTRGSTAPPSASSSPPPAAARASSTSSETPAADAVELPEERRRKIDELYVVVDLLDHYQVLGIERTADRAAVKAAYFELSKQFHPDTAFRKNVGAYRHKMEVVFKRLTEAYDVLSKKKAREEYDAYLARSERSLELERTLSGSHDLNVALAGMDVAPHPEKFSVTGIEGPSLGLPSESNDSAPKSETTAPPPGFLAGARPELVAGEEQQRGTEPDRAPFTSGGSMNSAVSATRASMSEEARARARELLARRLGSARTTASVRAMAPSRAASSAPPPSSTSRHEVARELASALVGTASVTGGPDPVARYLAEARRRSREGDLAGAVRQTKLALALVPDHPTARALHDELARSLAASLADNYAAQASYEEKHQKWAAAANSWQRVVEGRPGDPVAHWSAARALLESGGDVKLAVRLAQRAVELAPDRPEAVRTLGRAFLVAGMVLNARRELTRALELDPRDDATRALLAELDRN